MKNFFIQFCILNLIMGINLYSKEPLELGHRNSNNSIAIGNNSQALGPESVAIGQNTVTGKLGSIAIGNNADASRQEAIAVGLGSTIDGAFGVALGSGTYVNNNNGVAIGHKSTVEASDKNEINAKYLDNDKDNGVVSFGKIGEIKRRIINIAGGIANSDAASIGQLEKVRLTLQENIDDLDTQVKTLESTFKYKSKLPLEYTNEEIDTKVDKVSKDLDNHKNSMASKLSEKANASDVYTKSNVDSMLSKKANQADLDKKADKTTVTTLDTKVNGISKDLDIHKNSMASKLSEKANASDVYTKSNVD
ncbi:Head domain of trimeric autotransporter adhesin, partial [Cetobacterium ceti]